MLSSPNEGKADHLLRWHTGRGFSPFPAHCQGKVHRNYLWCLPNEAWHFVAWQLSVSWCWYHEHSSELSAEKYLLRWIVLFYVCECLQRRHLSFPWACVELEVFVTLSASKHIKKKKQTNLEVYNLGLQCFYFCLFVIQDMSLLTWTPCRHQALPVKCNHDLES